MERDAEVKRKTTVFKSLKKIKLEIKENLKHVSMYIIHNSRQIL
jgi:hypothetical protein